MENGRGGGRDLFIERTLIIEVGAMQVLAVRAMGRIQLRCSWVWRPVRAGEGGCRAGEGGCVLQWDLGRVAEGGGRR
jgi:hypothetical protein